MPEQSRWAVAEFAKKLNEHFTAGWRATEEERRRAWARRMLVAVAATFAALFAMIAVLHATVGSNHFPWEEKALAAIARGPVGFGTAIWLQTFGADFMLLAVAGGGAIIAVWQRRPLLALTILLSLVFMDAVVRIGWFSYARHRPALIAQGLAAPAFHSFPSGHTSKTFALYGLLFSQWIGASRSVLEKLIAGFLLLLIVVAVPYGRLRMGAHWPTDIMGGYVLGTVWLCMALYALKAEREL